MAKYCGECGDSLKKDDKHECKEKSLAGIGMEDLEKSLEALETVAKGVRPGPAKAGKDDKRTPAKYAEDASEDVENYWDEGEGESEEEPKTTKVGKDVKKGFPPDEDDDREEDHREDEEPSDEEEEEAGGERPEFPPKGAFKSAKSKKKAKKSLADTFGESDEIRKAVDVSDFLRDVTESLVDAQDTLTNRFDKSLRYQRNYNVSLAKALCDVASLIKSLNDNFEKIAAQPVAERKSDVNAAAVEKSFAGGEKSESGEQMTKSQMAAKLLDLQIAGDKSITSMDVALAESTGQVRPELKTKLGIN